MEFPKLFSLAKTFANLAKSEIDGSITRNKIKQLASSDHFGQLIISKAPTTQDKFKVMLTAWLLINKPRMSADNIYRIISNLYVLKVEIFEELTKGKVECSSCDGTGEERCEYCDGDGNIDCRYCDGEGKIECYECSGEGTEECRYCDGKGTETETEEDDEGEEVEVEVECVHCDGSGTENCRSCGGSGDYECPECDGSGSDTCGDCSGYGEYICGYCDGSGEEDSYEDYYEVGVYYFLIVGKSLMDYVGETITKEDFDDIENDDSSFDYYFILNRQGYTSDNDVDDTRGEHGMEDDFVDIKELVKFENYQGGIPGF